MEEEKEDVEFQDRPPEGSPDVSIATIETTPWPQFRDDPPPNYNFGAYNFSVEGRAGPSLRMESAVSTSAEHVPQPHDSDFGTRPPPNAGTMALLAMADIRLRSRYPLLIACPHCQMDIVTSIRPQRGVAAYLGCTTMALLGCFLGCCLIPLFLPACQNIQHFCPHCSQLIGTCHVL